VLQVGSSDLENLGKRNASGVADVVATDVKRREALVVAQVGPCAVNTAGCGATTAAAAAAAAKRRQVV
jgi:hypothetical protein